MFRKRRWVTWHLYLFSCLRCRNVGVAFAGCVALSAFKLSFLKQPSSFTLQRNRMKKNGGKLLSNSGIWTLIHYWFIYMYAQLRLDWTFAAGLSHEGLIVGCEEFNSSFENRLCFESRALGHLVLDKIPPVLLALLTGCT